jgi:hypothetical protein
MMLFERRSTPRQALEDRALRREPVRDQLVNTSPVGFQSERDALPPAGSSMTCNT